MSRSYTDVDAFLRCWDTVETYGDRLPLLRGMEARNGVELLRAVQDKHWAMVRLTKPNLTKYSGAPTELAEELEAYLDTGEPVLRYFGHVAPEDHIEISCYLEPDQHIPGWELQELKSRLERKQLPDGTPMRAARVTFLDRETAEREKRPLLDAGAQLQYYRADGELEPLRE